MYEKYPYPTYILQKVCYKHFIILYVIYNNYNKIYLKLQLNYQKVYIQDISCIKCRYYLY